MREVRRTHISDAGLVFFLDANGEVGSHECNAIGSHAAEREKTTNCLMLREAWMEFDMFLPATFGECVREEHEQWTWASSVGTIHQLDNVARSDNLRSNGVRAFVDDSVDLATMRPDHRLVACEFTLGGAKAANGTIDESVGTIGVQSNLSKLARGFGRHGLQLNYAAGKAECLVALRGKGAKALRERVLWLTRRYSLSSMRLGLFHREWLTLTCTWEALWLRAVPNVVSCKPGSKPRTLALRL